MKERTLLLSVLALLMLCACGGKSGQTGNADAVAPDGAKEDGIVSRSAEEKAKERIAGIINDLYDAAAHNAGDIDARFACHAWREMVAAVEEKDARQAEIGFFNDDYWTMMQDSNPDDLKVRDMVFEQLDVEKGSARVTFVLDSSVQTVRQKLTFCREEGGWRVHDIIRCYNDGDGKESSFSFMEAMANYLDERDEDMPELTFAAMAGIYDSMNEDGGNESRISLEEDGTATWCMIGSLHFTEFTYTILGRSICLRPMDEDSEEDCYEYDPDTRSLRNEQGDVYYRQDME